MVEGYAAEAREETGERLWIQWLSGISGGKSQNLG
jgi:hypothetical protein